MYQPLTKAWLFIANCLFLINAHATPVDLTFTGEVTRTVINNPYSLIRGPQGSVVGSLTLDPFGGTPSPYTGGGMSGVWWTTRSGCEWILDGTCTVEGRDTSLVTGFSLSGDVPTGPAKSGSSVPREQVSQLARYVDNGVQAWVLSTTSMQYVETSTSTGSIIQGFGTAIQFYAFGVDLYDDTDPYSLPAADQIKFVYDQSVTYNVCTFGSCASTYVAGSYNLEGRLTSLKAAPNQVPEPSSAALFGVALAGLTFLRRRFS